jgi:transcriptional regulator with XRE-family HTH domain
MTAIGEVGLRVAENIRDLRRIHRISYRGLADRLAIEGRPLVATAVLKIERGERRVDVDDLVALSRAFQVEPADLLLGRPVAHTEVNWR